MDNITKLHFIIRVLDCTKYNPSPDKNSNQDMFLLTIYIIQYFYLFVWPVLITQYDPKCQPPLETN